MKLGLGVLAARQRKPCPRADWRQVAWPYRQGTVWAKAPSTGARCLLKKNLRALRPCKG